MDTIIPLWLKILLSPWILWLIISPLIGSKIAWGFVFSNTGEDVQKNDKRLSVRKTWITTSLCNILSCVFLMVLEFIMRADTQNGSRLSSLVIWDSLLTVIVYMIPVIVSFVIIFEQVRRRGRYLISDKTPTKVAAVLMAVLYSPWFILIPSSLIWNMSEILQ